MQRCRDWGPRCANTTHETTHISRFKLYLIFGDPWREDQALIVRVDHNHDTDGARRDAPGVLVDEARLLALGVLEDDVEDLAEVLSQVVRGGTLDGATGGTDVDLHGGSVVTAGELLLLCLATWQGGGNLRSI